MTIKTSLAAIAAMAAVACATPAFATIDIVTNGGFEDDTNGWSIAHPTETGSVDSGFAGYTAHNGDRFLGIGDTTLGSVSQMLNTIAGQAYTLSYYLAAKGDSPAFFSATWNGEELTGSALIDPDTSRTYAHFVFAVTGTGSDLLSFRMGDQPSFLALDDVSVTTEGAAAPVPEPTSWALAIAGFGTIGAALRRRAAPVRGAIAA